MHPQPPHPRRSSDYTETSRHADVLAYIEPGARAIRACHREFGETPGSRACRAVLSQPPFTRGPRTPRCCRCLYHGIPAARSRQEPA